MEMTCASEISWWKRNSCATLLTQITGAGCVIRDHAVSLLQGGGKLLLLSSVPFVELTAAWLGLKVAIQQFSVLQICLEGDSSTVISWFSSPSLSAHGYHHLPLFQDIQAWKLANWLDRRYSYI